MSSQPPQPFGRYTLVELLGRGGMAEVWKAKLVGNAGVTRTVVVKRVRPVLAAEAHFGELFAREARLSARLSHANIVQIFEYGEHEGEPFLVMEYVAGRNLAEVLGGLIDSRQPLPVGLAVYVVREVARALAYAHDLVGDEGEPLGLVHRDISPSNIIIGFDGSVKLLDFGIAKAAGEGTKADLTTTGTFKGKVGYSAPEVSVGLPHDARSDLFGLGVVLHETLVGRRLFVGSTDAHTLFLVREGRIERPSTLNPLVSEPLDRITLKALARDPAQRYQRADDLAHDLDVQLAKLAFGAPQAAALIKRLSTAVPARVLESERAPSRDPARARRAPGRRGWVTAIVAVGALTAGLATAWGLGRVLRTPQQAVAPTVTAAPPPAEPVDLRPAPPEVLSLTVRSEPSGATVRLDDERVARGVTPLTLSIAADQAPKVLTLELAGHEPQTVPVGPELAQRFDVRLKRAKVKVDVRDGGIFEPFQ